MTRVFRDLLAVLALVCGLNIALAQPTPPPGVTIHVVQRGETLYDIAQAYGLTVPMLADLNSIANPNNIFVGQRLLVPTPGEPFPTPIPATAAPPTPAFHIVRGGETLFQIAQRYGLTVNALSAANDIGDPSLIYSGQRLIIPTSGSSTSTPAPAAAPLPAPLQSVELMPVPMLDGQTGRIIVNASAPISLSGTFLERGVIAASTDDGLGAVLLVGIPVGMAGGVYPLALTVQSDMGQTALEIPVQVSSKSYRREFINLLDDRTNLLDPVTDEAELNILRSVMSAFNPERYFGGLMGLPAAAGISSPFGSTRTYNGSDLQRIHTGTDFAGAPGSPIIAPASGRVVLADTLNIRGVATVIDHGWGVYTGYWHQSERYVNVGEFVTTGQVIGAIGSTGRVTGAHLHWELWVNGVPVDPMQWVSTRFAE